MRYFLPERGFYSLFSVLLTVFLLSRVALGQVINLPYYSNFDGGGNLFSDSTVSGSHWQLGTPSFGQTTGAHSVPNTWDVELSASYQNNSQSYLTSPFFNLGGNSNVIFSFWQNRNVEAGWDGTRVEYSTDSVSWFVLGSMNDPNATNWYTTNAINSSGMPAWDGMSGGWIQSTYNIGTLGTSGNICFRFVFTSDGSVTADGMSIDDFSIYLLPAKDAGVSAIQHFPFLAAGVTTSPFNITVKNYGSQAFNSFSVSYKINNGPPVMVPSTFNLLPNNIVNIVVPGFLVPAGQFNLCAYTTLALDTNHFNDTLCLNFLGLITASLPYSNNFDGVTSDWAAFTNSSGTSWQLGLPNYGATNSTHSGNKCWDINLDTSYSQNSICYLYSPIFNFTGIYNATLNFYQNRNTGVNDGVCIQYSTNVGNSWQPLGIYQDPSALNWYNGFLAGFSGTPGWTGGSFSWQASSYPLTILNNTDSVVFCFVFSSYFSTGDGFSLDDLSISIPAPVDAGVTQIQLPSLTPAGTVVSQIPVTVKNYGSQNLSNITVACTINGGAPQVSSFTVNIVPGASGMVNLPGFTSPSGSYTVCSYTSMVSDGNHVNDSLCMSSFGIPVLSLPFFDNFDNANLGWGTESLMNPADRWQNGTPVTGVPSSPFSHPNCWDINLNAPYTGPSLCYLYSPFFDFTNILHPVLSFMQNRNSESNWDGLRIEYNRDNTGWLLLGSVNDPNATNWYTNLYLNSSNLSGWSGFTPGWISCSYDLDALNIANGSLVQFRFVFTADVSVPADGVAIDDFSISTLLSEDAALTGLINPGGSVSSGVATSVVLNLKNNGLSTITNIDFSYQANGSMYGPFPWSGNLLTDSIVTVTLPPFLPAVGTNTITVYTSWPADLNKYNDTLKSTFTGYYAVSVPYANDFENNALGWEVYAASFAHTSWELGMPAFGNTTGTHSGDSCWDVNLHTECGNLANTILYTPIFNFTNASSSSLSCWINYDTEPFADGFYLEYTTNGNSWLTLGHVNDPLGYNWYNTIMSNNQPGWTINSQGWKEAKYNTSFLDGQPYVRMRFKFITDFAISSTGASIDDFSITNYTGVSEAEVNDFKMYPSPVSDFIFIELAEKHSKISEIKVSDMLGQDLLVIHNPVVNKNKYTINVASVKPGYYFIFIDSEKGGMRKMFIKVN